MYREHPLPRLSTGPTDLEAPLKVDLFIPATASLVDHDQAIDVTIANSLTAQHLPASSRTSGAAATNLEQNKHRLYGSICRAHNITLHPVGIDIFGALGSDGLDFVQHLANLSANRLGSLLRDAQRNICERLSVALHTFQARMITTRLLL